MQNKSLSTLNFKTHDNLYTHFIAYRKDYQILKYIANSQIFSFFTHLHHQRTFLVVTSINKKGVIGCFCSQFLLQWIKNLWPNVFWRGIVQLGSLVLGSSGLVPLRLRLIVFSIHWKFPCIDFNIPLCMNSSLHYVVFHSFYSFSYNGVCSDL